MGQKKLQNKGWNILFIVIISRGDKKFEKMKIKTHEVSWDTTRGDKKIEKTKGWRILSHGAQQHGIKN